MYTPINPWRDDFVAVRGRNAEAPGATVQHPLKYRVQVWGTPTSASPPLVLLHGWMDVAASFQFVVDALQTGRWLIAPDWRGFGQTQVPGVDTFWFPDYLADLDALLDHYAPERPVDLMGHSMGGNIAMLYAGIRPKRVRRLINLEGFGMPATRPAQAPARYGQWLDQLRQVHSGEMDMRSYDSLEAVARRLIKTNPRLAPERAAWLAPHWARETSPGQWQIQGHPAHRIRSANLYRADEAQAVHACIEAPTLVIEAEDDSLALLWRGSYTRAQFHERLQVVRRLEVAQIPQAGHMLHHDQPQAVAALVERFLA